MFGTSRGEMDCFFPFVSGKLDISLAGMGPFLEFMRGIMTKVYLPTYRNGQFERLQQQTHKANNFIISMNFIVSRRQQLEKNKDAGQHKKNQRTQTLLNNLANTKTIDGVIKAVEKTWQSKGAVKTPPKEAFKRNACSAPSLIPRPVLTPSNLRSSSKKMGYSREGKKLYTDTPATQNAYNFACLQNMGTLQLFLNKCTEHTKTCGGTFVFKGDCTKALPTFFHGTCFCCFQFQCSVCSANIILESDYFEQKPQLQERGSCISRFSKLALVASFNMSWVHEDQLMLFTTQGVPFWSSHSFGPARENIGQTILELADKVVEKNLRDEMKLSRSGLGLVQTPIEPARRMTEDEIEVLSRTQALNLLRELEFPTGKVNVGEAKDILRKLFTESVEFRTDLVKAAHGEKQFVRIQISADGSWAVRSYNNASRSPFGQAAVFGALTRSVIGWGFRVMSCKICQRADKQGKIPKDHLCAINHLGTVKAMESEIILEVCTTLISKGAVPAEIALDGDSTTIAVIRKTLVHLPEVRLFGGEVVVDMKSDDRHRNKTTKDRFYEITRKHTLVVEGTKFTPLAEPQDCYYLSRLPNMLKCQIQAMDELSLDEKVHVFQKKMKNAPIHYFNDDLCKHNTCEEVGFHECEVVQARLHNCLAVLCKKETFRFMYTNALGQQFDFGDLVIGHVSQYLGFKGFQTFPVTGYYALEKVCPKLAGNVWLGERCANAAHIASFRKDIKALFDQLCESYMAKKILRQNDTQCSESLHSRQARLYRKDIAHGGNIEYVHCMASGILQYTLGHCYVPQLCDTTHTTLPPSAVRYYEARHKTSVC